MHLCIHGLLGLGSAGKTLRHSGLGGSIPTKAGPPEQVRPSGRGADENVLLQDQKEAMEKDSHYLDDFLFFLPPSLGLELMALLHILAVFESLGVPVALPKVEGPASVVTFLAKLRPQSREPSIGCHL